MQRARSIIASFLVGILSAGQLGAAHCSMLTIASGAEETNAHAHDEHGDPAPAESRDGGDVPTSDSEQPAPCVMAFSCATAGIIETPTALLAPCCAPVTTSLLTATIYVEPVLAAITPPPRV